MAGEAAARGWNQIPAVNLVRNLPGDLQAILDKIAVATPYQGDFAGVTDANAYLTVTHGLGFAPSHVFVQGPPAYSGTTEIMLGVDSITGTTFRVRALTLASTTPAGDFHVQLRASSNIGGLWVAFR